MMDVLSIRALGREPIAIWRWPRLTHWVLARWQRVVRRRVTSTHVLLHLGPQTSLAEQLASASAMACVLCGRPVTLPRIPSGLYQRTTFGCGRCGAYFYLDQSPDADVYDEIARRLAERSA